MRFAGLRLGGLVRPTNPVNAPRPARPNPDGLAANNLKYHPARPRRHEHCFQVLTLDAGGPSFADPGKTAKYQDGIEVVSDDHRILWSQVQDDEGQWHR